MANYTLSTFPSTWVYSLFMYQNNAIAAGDPGLYYSSDYGHSWTLSNVTTGYFNSVFMYQNNAIAVTESEIYYSSDYGHNWTLSNAVYNRWYWVFMYQNNALCVGGVGIYYSSDYGANWLQSNITTGYFDSVFMDQSGNAIAASDIGLYYSSDYGHNWTLSNVTTGYFLSVFMDQSGNAIAASDIGLYYSSDYGHNWTLSNITTEYIYLYMDQSGNAMAASSSGLIYSSDYGHIWNPTNVNTNTDALFIDNNGNRLAGGEKMYYFAPLVCFKEGTKILTDKGYIAIQDLKKGDLVKTLNDFIPIYAIGKREIFHPATQNRDKDQLYKCSPDHFHVFEDLVITGCHSILVDEFKEGERDKTVELLKGVYITEKKYRLPACVDERTVVYETPGNYTIYHFALENNDYYMNYGVYANGLLVETCSKRYLTKLSNMDMV